ncbi:hypothetical protein BDA96_09G058200 [Sorghum bicolor]|uniref:Uncharacterized protein n=2 Tax=Sorghum bicolor TaxID=4558 RepID=A0A1B6P6X2_SORBI|nr:hypothetical protein BDA96_09G058200 [Sorghum bicolor]KXG21382.1 hypothetical protein SORBI_3009G055000 [Sorghum bicolor]KXG21383.1 hypothetical protein SORBI_3009G055000 [Sorghum bicolor]OQU77491.1 hypothetical protein SORBI_3009G055000 [Sorghum bicolor]
MATWRGSLKGAVRSEDSSHSSLAQRRGRFRMPEVVPQVVDVQEPKSRGVIWKVSETCVPCQCDNVLHRI